MPKKVECIRTSSELEREVDGLVTHFAKHLSLVFCVKVQKEGSGQNATTLLCFFFGTAMNMCVRGGSRKNNYER
jgi:hypothetical protein